MLYRIYGGIQHHPADVMQKRTRDKQPCGGPIYLFLQFFFCRLRRLDLKFLLVIPLMAWNLLEVGRKRAHILDNAVNGHFSLRGRFKSHLFPTFSGCLTNKQQGESKICSICVFNFCLGIQSSGFKLSLIQTKKISNLFLLLLLFSPFICFYLSTWCHLRTQILTKFLIPFLVSPSFRTYFLVAVFQLVHRFSLSASVSLNITVHCVLTYQCCIEK
jgi:hypothetical protein